MEQNTVSKSDNTWFVRWIRNMAVLAGLNFAILQIMRWFYTDTVEVLRPNAAPQFTFEDSLTPDYNLLQVALWMGFFTVIALIVRRLRDRSIVVGLLIILLNSLTIYSEYNRRVYENAFLYAEEREHWLELVREREFAIPRVELSETTEQHQREISNLSGFILPDNAESVKSEYRADWRYKEVGWTVSFEIANPSNSSGLKSFEVTKNGFVEKLHVHHTDSIAYCYYSYLLKVKESLYNY